MAEERRAGKHRLVVEQRESVSVSGVMDVISFDEEQVICETDMGVLILRGTNLHVTGLNLEKGSLEIFGEIVAINYEAEVQGSRKKASMFGKIFK